MDKHTMTDKQISVRSEIERLSEVIRNSEKKLSSLRKDCSHFIGDITDKERVLLRNAPWKVSMRVSIATCTVCGLDFGWKCPDSPDSVCHYYTTTEDSETFYVELIDRTKHQMSKYDLADAEYETDDECLFCGHPDERK